MHNNQPYKQQQTTKSTRHADHGAFLFDAKTATYGTEMLLYCHYGALLDWIMESISITWNGLCWFAVCFNAEPNETNCSRGIRVCSD
jgi:hypothetical protein